MQSYSPLVSHKNSGRGNISHCAQSRSLQLHLHLLHSRNNAYRIFSTLPNVGDLFALMRDMRRTNVNNNLSGPLKRGQLRNGIMNKEGHFLYRTKYFLKGTLLYFLTCYDSPSFMLHKKQTPASNICAHEEKTRDA